MAAKFDAEMMKKQHFWLLFIPVLIGLLLAWIGLFFGVADATEEKQKANDAAKAEVARAKAQPKKTLDLYDKRKNELFELRTQRWKEMWELQQGIFEWPKVLGDDQTAKVKDFKFGKDINDSSFLNAFRDHYAKEYEELAANASPLQFANGWNTVLRHVSKWNRNPTSEDVWLAMEDFWVEKEFVRALTSVNESAARFEPKQGEKAGARQGTFFNRIWEVNLQLVDLKGSTVVQGTIKNRTDRLQPYNASNELVLNLWLEDGPTAQPFRFAIEGNSLDGGKTEPIKLVERKHTVLQGSPRGIYRVEQVFDTRTAPVKRLDRLELGYLSDRHNRAELQMPSFSTKSVEDEKKGKDMGMDMGMGGAFPGAGGPMGGGAVPGAPVVGGPGAPGGGNTGTAAAADDLTFNGLNRRRYVNKTDQVRALPVGITVIVDQAYVQDALTAISNTKLRFQTVQTHLGRYRNSLTYSMASTGSTSGPGAPGPGSPMGGDSSLGPKPGGGSASPPSGGSSLGPKPGGGSASPPSGGSSLGPAPGSGTTSGSSIPPGGAFGGGSSAPRSSNEDQVASNLIEINLYGVTQLYERFEAAPAKKDETAVSIDPNPKTPKENTPIAPKDGSPMAPKDGTPMPPKDGTPMPPTGKTDPKDSSPTPPKM